MTDGDSSSNIIVTTREEIKQLNVNMCRLRREIPDIIHEEIEREIKKLIKELRRPIERGYKY
jgi:hypothetical protein